MHADNPPPVVTLKRVRQPRLPLPLAAPFALLPDTLHLRLFVTALNYALNKALSEGELGFMDGRCVVIKVRDLGVACRLSLTGNRLVVGHQSGPGDLIIEGTLYDFLVLVSRQEDPDTLVFQRRLLIKGDTELGLQVKYFLDGLDVDSLGWYHTPAAALRRALPVYARLFG